MKIGDLELDGAVVLAPMVGITDPPFRRTVQQFGVSALWTEMISAQGLKRGKLPRTVELAGHMVPTVFQIYGQDPDIMGEAAARLQDLGAAAIDVNMGCPAKKIVKQGAGVALMKDFVRAGRIVAAVRKTLQIPLTVKIRSGWDENSRNAAELGVIVANEGADGLIVHSRTRSSGHKGPVSFGILAQVKQRVNIPVIGNGGVKNFSDSIEMMQETGCDGIMIGRGALGRPWIPGRILEHLEFASEKARYKRTLFEVISSHFQDMLGWVDRTTAVHRMRKHLVWYSKGLPGATGFRELVLKLEDPEPVMVQLKSFFGGFVIP